MPCGPPASISARFGGAARGRDSSSASPPCVLASDVSRGLPIEPWNAPPLLLRAMAPRTASSSEPYIGNEYPERISAIAAPRACSSDAGADISTTPFGVWNSVGVFTQRPSGICHVMARSVDCVPFGHCGLLPSFSTNSPGLNGLKGGICYPASAHRAPPSAISSKRTPRMNDQSSPAATLTLALISLPVARTGVEPPTVIDCAVV